MVVRHNITGYEHFTCFMKDFTSKEPIYMLFSGSKLPCGESWCPDCVKSRPVIEEALEKYAGPDSIFLDVEVGDRSYWKDMHCPFKKDKKLQLLVVPTFLQWNTVKRLVGLEQCEKIELLELVFTEDI